MNTAWIVAIERYGNGGGPLDIPAPIGEQAIALAAELATRDPQTQVVLSHSLPPTGRYSALLASLPASIQQTGATQQDLLNALPSLRGDGTLVIYWIGHGIMASNKRLLLCADSDPGAGLRAVEVDSLLTHLRSAEFPRHQVGFFDACAQIVSPATVVTFGGDGAGPTDQYFYFSASAAEVAAATIGPLGFSGTVIALLTDPHWPFPPQAKPLFAELGRRFDQLQLSTRAFPLQRTCGSSDLWDYIDKTGDSALASFARAARCTPSEFGYLRSAAAGVDDQRLCDALRDARMPTLLDELNQAGSAIPRVRVQLLHDAWQRLELARQLESVCAPIGLPWPEWQALAQQVVALDNLREFTAISFPDLILGLLDQHNPERALASCIRLLLLAARRARFSEPGRADAFKARARALPRLAPQWDSVAASMPQLDGPVYLLVGLDYNTHGAALSIANSWLYRDVELDPTWDVVPGPGSVVEQVSELIQIAKVRYQCQPIVEVLAPTDLLCSPRELFELADTDFGTRIWLEAQAVLVLRWHDRMKGAPRFMPGNWVERARLTMQATTTRPDLDLAWIDEPPPAHIVGLPFPGPSLALPKRNRAPFFSALLIGDPWMCWPRVEPGDLGAFKQRVRTFIQDHGLNAGQPHAIAEALRRERSVDHDPILCSLWFFIDEPKRNPYAWAFADTTQRTIT